MEGNIYESTADSPIKAIGLELFSNQEDDQLSTATQSKENKISPECIEAINAVGAGLYNLVQAWTCNCDKIDIKERKQLYTKLKKSTGTIVELHKKMEKTQDLQVTEICELIRQFTIVLHEQDPNSYQDLFTKPSALCMSLFKEFYIMNFTEEEILKACVTPDNKPVKTFHAFGASWQDCWRKSNMLTGGVSQS